MTVKIELEQTHAKGSRSKRRSRGEEGTHQYCIPARTPRTVSFLVAQAGWATSSFDMRSGTRDSSEVSGLRTETPRSLLLTQFWTALNSGCEFSALGGAQCVAQGTASKTQSDGGISSETDGHGNRTPRQNRDEQKSGTLMMPCPLDCRKDSSWVYLVHVPSPLTG